MKLSQEGSNRIITRQISQKALNKLFFVATQKKIFIDSNQIIKQQY